MVIESLGILSQGALDGLASEDGCLDVCLHNLGQFHVQMLEVSALPRRR